MRPVARLAPVAALAAIAALDVYLKAEVAAGLDPALRPLYSDDAGDPYFYTQDSFYYYRQSAAILDHGHPGTRRIGGAGGEPWDDLSFAPAGRPAQGGLLASLQAWTARLAGAAPARGSPPSGPADAGGARSAPSSPGPAGAGGRRRGVSPWDRRGPGPSLAAVATFLPAVVTALLVPLLFALGRRLGGTACGLVAALFAAVHPVVVSHCHAGIADTGSLNLVFVTATVWAVVGLADRLAARARPEAAAYAAALAGVLVLFRWTWAGWIAAAALGAAWLGARGLAAAWGVGRGEATRGEATGKDAAQGDAADQPTKPDLSVPVDAAGAPSSLRRSKRLAAILARVGLGGRRRLRLAAALGGAAAGAAVLVVAGWPAWRQALVYLGLGPRSFFPHGTAQVMELQAPSPGELLASLGGPLFAVLAAVGIVLALRRPGPDRDPRWLAALLLAWLVPALATGAAALRFLLFAAPPLALFAAFAVVRLAAKPARLSDRRARAGAIALAALAVAATFAPQLAEISRRRPAIDRAVAEAARTIRARAAPDALLNVWWDRGYAYAALAGRGVVLDGGSYQTSRLYWFSRALAARDEEFAVAALRLIDCGAEGRLYDLLRPVAGRAGAVALLDELLHRHRPVARAKSLLAAGVPRRIGAPVLDLLDCRPPEAWLVVSGDLAWKTTSWVDLAHWRFDDARPPAPVPAITAETRCRLDAGLLACDGGPVVTLEAGGFVPRGTPGRFAARGRPNPEGLVPILYDPGDGLRLVYAGPAVAGSLFVELYYFRGAGLERFALAGEFYEPASGERVLVYRVEW
jgi:hypothetical protein